MTKQTHGIATLHCVSLAMTAVEIATASGLAMTKQCVIASEAKQSRKIATLHCVPLAMTAVGIATLPDKLGARDDTKKFVNKF